MNIETIQCTHCPVISNSIADTTEHLGVNWYSKFLPKLNRVTKSTRYILAKIMTTYFILGYRLQARSLREH